MLLSIFKSLLIFLYFSVICITLCTCYNVKNISAYKKVTIEDDKICSPITKRKIELKPSGYNALYVSQSRTRDHIAKWSKHLVCKFQVDASSYGGLFAMVQNINFRKNETTGECIDYIQFHSRDKISSGPICGYFNVANTLIRGSEEDKEVNEGHLTFGGKIDTEIFIHREKLFPGQTMDLKIVYTAFKRCNPSLEQTSCLSGSPYFCINPEFFNDSIANCPYSDCLDEGSCSSVAAKENDILYNDKDDLSTKVILSAVTSLIVSFVCVIVVIWLCRKMGAVCWTMNFSNMDRSTPSRTQSRVIEMQNRSDVQPNPSVTSQPSAPDDKDLPPSYESLFPQR